MRLGRDLRMKRVVKATLAATMLFSVVLGRGVVANAKTVTPVVTAKPTTSAVPTATVKPTATPAPIMRDNLSKFGLKKDLELPVTVTAGGLSYTLEKLMVYDINSKDAKDLIKKYGYSSYGEYFIWTKITIENKGNTVIEESAKDLSQKWNLTFSDGGTLYPDMPEVKVRENNSKEALWNYQLSSGQKLTTYQGFNYRGKFDYFVIRLSVKGTKASKTIVNDLNSL